MKINKYPKFVKDSVSANLDRYRKCIFDQVDYLVSNMPIDKSLPIPEDTVLNFQTTILALLDGLGQEIVDLAEDLGDIDYGKI